MFVAGQGHKAAAGTYGPTEYGRASVRGPQPAGLYRKKSGIMTEEKVQFFSLTPLFWQEEDLQEIVAKIASKRAEYDEARAQTAELKASYEKAEQEYKQHKEEMNTVAEEADPVKVSLPVVGIKKRFKKFIG